GRFESGMRVYHRRLGKEVRLGRAEQLFAQDRESIEQAWPGDIVGLFDPGLFRIGDTLSQFGPELAFDEVPRFSPERFARVRLRDPMRRKQFQKGIEELCEEGAVQLFVEPGSEKDPICGVVGPLQLEVLVFRLEHEYGARVELEPLDVTVARWVEGASGPAELIARRVPRAVLDLDGRPVALFHDEWEENRARRDNPGWTLHATAPMGPRPSGEVPS
ncbi:MAG: peptide chain release factor 3, partial [Myxococcota bacterium]|nr:peptide chain release factor 3 [Myxococcota bacterium]